MVERIAGAEADSGPQTTDAGDPSRLKCAAVRDDHAKK
jgi:hypothetical protein